MTLDVTILGCGSSGGVPRVASGWGACNPANPRNRRQRCSILVEQVAANGGRTTVLVDTGPDLRQQLLAAEVTALDGVLFTHEHADHTHGIDDLRPMVIHHRRRINVFCDEATSRHLRGRFDYCFETPQGSDYPPIVVENRIAAGRQFNVDGEGGPLAVLPFRQFHGNIDSLGFRFGGIAYSSDLIGLPDESLPHLAGLDLWIIDALRYARHPSHLSLTEALEWVARLKPKRAVLTNLHTDLDYDALVAQLPSHIVPAYDGLRISI